jgi:twitching motility protein PilT
MQAGRQLGMQTLDQHLADLVNAGVITHRAALERVHDIEGFGRLVHRIASGPDLGAGSIDFGDAFSGRN